MFIYLDDILIFSRSLEEHQQHVRQVLERLLRNRLFVKAEKCEFHTPSVAFLGYIVAAGGIRMDPAKVVAVEDWPQPKNRKQLQRFLRSANFYRQFIQNYSRIAAPLSTLTSTSKKFSWNPEAEKVFLELKNRFTLAPILVQTPLCNSWLRWTPRILVPVRSCPSSLLKMVSYIPEPSFPGS